MERVLERAIRIHAERAETTVFTRQQVDQIASELGLSRTVVERALEEELEDRRTPDGERPSWFGPRSITESTHVEGGADEVADRTSAWMESEEGLRPVARVDRGIRWERDTHWTTGARLALGSEGTKALRGMSQVTHRQTSLGPDHQSVEIEVDTSTIRLTSMLTGAGIGLAGVGGGVAAALGLQGGGDLAEFALVGGPVLAAALATAVAIGKGWAYSVRRGAERALDGIAHPDLYRRATRRMARRQGGTTPAIGHGAPCGRGLRCPRSTLPVILPQIPPLPEH